MANEFKVRKGLIVQGSGSNIFDVQGSQGQLFSITDSLSGSLFSVNDISGIPIMEVFSDNTIKLGTFNNEAIIVSGSRTGMGIATPQAKLHISGASNSGLFEIDSSAVNNIIYVSGSGRVGIGTNNPTNTLQVVGGVTATSFTGSLFGTSSWATNALTASNITPSITNNTDNRVLTATGGGTINGESNLTFDGSVLTVTGRANISTSITSSTATVGFGLTSALNAGQTTIRGSGVDTVGALTIQNSGGTAVFTVLNGGTTGVGENNPSARLHVKGSGATSATTALRVENSSAAARLTILDDGTSAFNTSHLYVSSSGRVGIGTATPSYTLDTVGNVRLTNVASQLIIDNATYSELNYGTSNYFRADGSAATIRGPIIIFLSASTEIMRINSSGDVGIGTTNTSARLHVSGASNSNLLRVGSPAQANILFITGSGNIGVGTTTPGVTLDVVGQIRASSTMFNSTTQTNTIQLSSATNLQFLSASVETARYDNNGWGFFNTTPTARVHISGANADNLFRVSSPTQANALFVSGSGNVGIGTNLPSAELHISGESVDSLLRVGSPTNSDILFVNGNGRVGINTTSSRAFFSGSGGFFGSGEGNIAPTLTIFQSSSATGLNAAGLQIVGSGSSAFAAARLNILTMGDKYAYLNIGTSGSGTENNYWEFTKASSTYAHTLYLSNYSNGVFQSNIMALVPGANTSTIGTNNQIFLEGSTGYIGLQTSNTGTQEWIHLYSARIAEN